MKLNFKSIFLLNRCKTGDRPPDNAVQGGFDGGPSYHARGEVRGKIIPGKAGVKEASDVFYLKGACIPYGSREHRIHDFQVLVMADKIERVEFDCDRGKRIRLRIQRFLLFRNFTTIAACHSQRSSLTARQ